MLKREDILAAIPHALRTVDLQGFGVKESGKVRDSYRYTERQRIIITTDRVSAFDRVLGYIPFKGQVLNELSAWWFQQTEAIIPNHLIAVPDPNVMIVREAQPLPLEVIVRGYISGVTSTSLWKLYERGERRPYGIPLPDGLRKNDPLPRPIITPTTKAARGQHDEQLTREQIIATGLVEKKLWEQIESVALELFEYGQKIARQAGLALVDTKYEFGLIDDKLTIIDELHTPDSSRYWAIPMTGDTPEHFDKEFLRHWFANQGYYGDGPPPTMPDAFIADVAERYIIAYEKLTTRPFHSASLPTSERIQNAMNAYRQVNQ